MQSLPSHLGDAPYPSPSTQAAHKPMGRPRKVLLRLEELEYLRLFIEIKKLYPDMPERAAELQALTDAGFDTAGKTPLQLRKLRYDVLQNIDKALDVKSALEQAGMGIAAWIRLIARLANSGELKYEAVAGKYWALALQLFAPANTGQGASIIIGAQAQGDGAQVAAQVRWPQRAVPPAGDDEPELLPPDPDVQAQADGPQPTP